MSKHNLNFLLLDQLLFQFIKLHIIKILHNNKLGELSNNHTNSVQYLYTIYPFDYVEHNFFFALYITVNCMSRGRLRGTSLSSCMKVEADYKPKFKYYLGYYFYTLLCIRCFFHIISTIPFSN